MKIVYTIVALFTVILVTLGIFVFFKVSKNIKNEVLINERRVNLPFVTKPGADINKDMGFTMTFTDEELEKQIAQNSKGVLQNPKVSISSSDITLRAEGKKIIPYSFETIIVPEVRNEKIDLKISEIKIFGLPGNVIKKEIENILNKEVSTKINENAKIKNIELKPSKLLVKGEML